MSTETPDGRTLVPVQTLPTQPSGSYKQWIGLFSVNISGDVTVTEIVNKIGTIEWEAILPGSYIGQCLNAFTADKTVIFVQKDCNSGDAVIVTASQAGVSDMQINCYAWVEEEGSGSWVLSDGMLNKTQVEIRVYN